MTTTPGQLANRIIAIATDFVGLVEKEENSHWDDPHTPFPDSQKDAWLRKWMAKIPGWTPGAPYCVAFDGGVIANAIQQLLGPDAMMKFATVWTAHVMTNVRELGRRGLLEAKPAVGGVWFARHGNTDMGHAGVVVDPAGTTIEANTSAGPTADPNEQRQGDGIWIRHFDLLQGRGTLRTQGFISPTGILQLL